MIMKDVRQIYNAQIRDYNEKKFALSKQREQLQKKMDTTLDGNKLFAEEAATLELSINALNDKQSEYQKYMDKLMEQWTAKCDAISSEQQADAMAEGFEELGKIMEVARRLIRGDIVPLSDERKLMEFDKDLYMMAKNVGSMIQHEKKKKYDSLWDDEEKKEYEDPIEAADSMEVSMQGPEIVSVEETLMSVSEQGAE